MTSSIPSHRASLDDLVALNQEITALVAAGVPLHHGLALLGRDLPGRLGRITARLSESLAQGKSFSEAVSDEELGLPEIYRAVIEAGLRSGRLAAALEGMTHTVARMADIRRTAGLALFYPCLVLILAWTLFCAMASLLSESFVQLGVVPEWVGAWLSGLTTHVYLWGPLVPLLVVSIFVAWWTLAGRATKSDPQRNRSMRLGTTLPARIRHDGSCATFAEIFALLIEHQAPMDESLCLAGDASGHAALRRCSHDAAAAVRRGEPLADVFRKRSELPPFLRLTSLVAHDRSAWARAGRRAGEAYRRRAQQHADTLRVVLPALLTVLIGGGAALAYALAIYWPWVTLLKNLGAG